MESCENFAKFAVLAFDCSGSVGHTDPIFRALYWPNVEKLYRRLMFTYNRNVIFIRWDSSATEIDSNSVEKMYREMLGYGGTHPAVIWPVLQTAINRKILSDFSYDLYLTTDGRLKDKGEYVRGYQGMSLKPKKSYVYFWGYGKKMKMTFLDALPPPVEYFIHGIDNNGKLYEHQSTKVDSSALYKQLIELPEYKILKTGPAPNALDQKNLSNLYITLYRKYAEYSEKELRGDVGNNFTRFGTEVNQLGQNWLPKIPNITNEQKRIIETMLAKILELTSGKMQVNRGAQIYGKQTYEQMQASLMKK